MNFFSVFHKMILEKINHSAELLGAESALDLGKLTLEPPKDPTHGDVSTNAALILTKQVGKKSSDIADILLPLFKEIMPKGTEFSVAGPGFINFRFAPTFWHEHLALIAKNPASYQPTLLGKGQKVHVEYVSANPTGPLHTGHTRNAVLGDALASTLEAVGYQVHREYYVNDAGAQVDTVARSIHLRYRQLFGDAISNDMFEGLYPSEYVIDLAKTLKERVGNQFYGAEETVWMDYIRTFAVEEIMAEIKVDLEDLGVVMDTYTSEASLVNAGKVEQALKLLEAKGDVYVGVLEPPKGMVVEDFEPRPQTLFRATAYGDTVDRALKKSDGSWSYFAPDIAYHLDKFERGYTDMIDVLSADHMGYFTRIKAAVKAVSDGKANVQIRDYQMVNFLDNGVPVKMSKRAGTFITLRDLLDRVGKDVVRFIMLMRHHDVVIDFDFAKVLENSKDNPVFYVQYAHARICSVLRYAREIFGEWDVLVRDADLSLLADDAEFDLIKILAQFPRAVEVAAAQREPHRIAYYLHDVASYFHSLWNRGKENTQLRFIEESQRELTFARLALLYATKEILAKGLNIFKITPAEEMR